LIETKLLRPFSAKHVQFFPKFAGFDAVTNCNLQFFEVDRFSDEVVGAAA